MAGSLSSQHLSRAIPKAITMSSNDIKMYESDLDDTDMFGPDCRENFPGGILFVRLHWVDLSGVLRTRSVSANLYRRIILEKDEYLVTRDCMAMPIAAVLSPPSPAPERWSLRPDPNSLRMCGLAEKHLTSFCATACEGLSIGTGNKFLKCPRSI